MAELPYGFEYLRPYVVSWGSLATQKDRYLLRQRSDMASLERFYGDAAPRLEEIFTHLDRFPVEDPLPPSEQLLFNITLGLAEAAQAVEFYGEPGVPFARPDQIVWIESAAI